MQAVIVGIWTTQIQNISHTGYEISNMQRDTDCNSVRNELQHSRSEINLCNTKHKIFRKQFSL